MKERTRSKEDTIQALHAVAAEMHDRMMRGEPPRMTLPVRSKKNINFDERLNVYKYGNGFGTARLLGTRVQTPHCE